MTQLIKVGRLPFLIVGLALYFLGAFWAVLVGGSFSPSRLLIGCLIILSAQLSVHFSNDYFDISSDRPGKSTLISGGGGVLLAHPELRKPVMWIAVILILLSTGLGIAFVKIFTYPFWMAGFVILGNLLGWFYSAPPLRLSQRGFGELCYTFISGILIPWMGYLVIRGVPDLEGFFFTIPLTLYGLASILSVELPDMEDDRQGNKKTWIVRYGRAFGFITIGWLLFAATIYFFIFPIFYRHKIPINMQLLGLFSLIPLGAGFFGLYKKPADREPATRIATLTIILLVGFSIIVDTYLFYLAVSGRS